MMSLNQAPGRQKTSPRGGSVQHIEFFVPFRRKFPINITIFFFLVVMVMVLGAGLFDRGNTSGVDGSSSLSIDWP